ncbi:MAG TPA: ABC transporter substrate-binding protein, partial [Bacteroidota bacterium]|nr:ABC transporter substrate-binding protein [Bacteroidota bacterium]
GEPKLVFSGKIRKADADLLVSHGLSARRIDSLRAAKASVNIFSLFGPFAHDIVDSLKMNVSYGDHPANELNEPVTNFDAIFVPIAEQEEIGVVTSQLAYFNIKSPILGNALWYAPSQLEANKQYTDGLTFCSDTFIDDADPRVKSFGTGFIAEAKRSPSKYSMFGYDAMDLLLKAIESGSTTRESIAKTISAMHTFKGLHTTIEFDEHRTNVLFSILKYHANLITKIGEVRAK